MSNISENTEIPEFPLQLEDVKSKINKEHIKNTVPSDYQSYFNIVQNSNHHTEVPQSTAINPNEVSAPVITNETPKTVGAKITNILNKISTFIKKIAKKFPVYVEGAVLVIAKTILTAAQGTKLGSEIGKSLVGKGSGTVAGFIIGAAVGAGVGILQGISLAVSYCKAKIEALESDEFVPELDKTALLRGLASEIAELGKEYKGLKEIKQSLETVNDQMQTLQNEARMYQVHKRDDIENNTDENLKKIVEMRQAANETILEIETNLENDKTLSEETKTEIQRKLEKFKKELSNIALLANDKKNNDD
ncbi:MAG: hypothetical protein LBB11_01020 [Puniceicoccales bacterium]|nr:hypothetical protein [Puniceicoccales bacterium]